ncbi:MAG: hypothetical protein ACFFD3_11395 [Candidatus Thorarchaeota archaeon]
MSTLDERSLDNLADIIYNVMAQDLLTVFRGVRDRMASEGTAAIKNAFDAARERFLTGPFADHIEVRWGMNLCLLCNDDNIEKNGIAYVQQSGDGLEFNQCLNCRIGILYNLVTANATMDSYVIGLGQPGQFNGMSFYWVAIPSNTMKRFQPMYEVIKDGQWIGTVSFDVNFDAKFLPFNEMTATVSRDAEEPWTTNIPDDLVVGVQQFIETARDQIEVALIIE